MKSTIVNSQRFRLFALSGLLLFFRGNIGSAYQALESTKFFRIAKN